MEKLFTISAFTENSPGVLHRITVLFTRRKLNIESLTVSETEIHNISRFTIVVRTTREIAGKIVPQIRRIIEVRNAYASEDSDLVFKEVALFRVTTPTPEIRNNLEAVTHRQAADIIFADEDSVIIQRAGSEDEVRSLYHMLEPFGIREFVRSGRIAIRRTPIDSVDGLAVSKVEPEPESKLHLI